MGKAIALVTGGARGIGLGISRMLAENGYDLAICGVKPQAAVSEILEELRALGNKVLYCQADVSVASDRANMMEQITANLGRINLLVNNAGVAPNVRADILEASEESYERVMKINLQGPYFLTQMVAKHMLKQLHDPDYRGCIVNITSISSTVASVARGEYCLSKAALSMSTKLWSVRLAEYGIPVYEIRPGIIRTDMTAGVKEKYDNLIAKGLLLQSRWGEPQDVGRAVLMLARGDLPYSTGQVLMVDGGLTAERL